MPPALVASSSRCAPPPPPGATWPQWASGHRRASTASSPDSWPPVAHAPRTAPPHSSAGRPASGAPSSRRDRSVHTARFRIPVSCAILRPINRSPGLRKRTHLYLLYSQDPNLGCRAIFLGWRCTVCLLSLRLISDEVGVIQRVLFVTLDGAAVAAGHRGVHLKIRAAAFQVLAILHALATPAEHRQPFRFGQCLVGQHDGEVGALEPVLVVGVRRLLDDYPRLRQLVQMRPDRVR